MKLHQLHEEERHKKNVSDVYGGSRCGDSINIQNNELESLLHSPEKVSGVYRVDNNNLTSLEYGPKHVDDDFSCRENRLTSLEFGPTYVGGAYNCGYNELTSLVGAPEIVHAGFYCGVNKLTSLDGAPYVMGSLTCHDNELVSVENKSRPNGMIVYGDVSLTQNRLTSLHMIHKSFLRIEGIFFGDRNPMLKNNLLGLLLIPGLTYISLDYHGPRNILNEYLYLANKDPNRKRVMLRCQQALIEAGFEDAAQL